MPVVSVYVVARRALRRSARARGAQHSSSSSSSADELVIILKSLSAMP
jgi:hypothetical protein